MTTLYSPKGKKTSTQSITERVKTFDDACEVLGLNDVQVGVKGLDDDTKSIEAYAKLTIIARALNEGWTPDWSDSDQYKYTVRFYHKSGFGLSYDDCGHWNSSTGVSSRLCFPSRDNAEYCFETFKDLYEDYLLIG